MTSSTPAADWVALAGLDQEERVQQMKQRFEALSALPDADRREELRPLIEAVFALPDAELRTMTESRMRAWLAMDDEPARAVSRTYEAVLDDSSAAVAMKRVAVAQHVAQRLTPEERERLRALVPGVIGKEPSRVSATPAKGHSDEPNRSRWAFWR